MIGRWGCRRRIRFSDEMCALMLSQDLIEDFLSRRVFAVVGATRNREKYGYKIFRSLKDAAYKVYPVNPKYQEIDGERCYASLSDLPEKPDVVDIVVPPDVTERIVREAHRLGIKRIWMQPGSESESAIKFCEENGISVLHGVCIMLESLKRNAAADRASDG